MRVILQTELNRLSRPELMTLMRRIVCEFPALREGSIELRNAHANLHNIAARWRGPGRCPDRKCPD